MAAKSKAEMMKALYHERKAEGLVLFKSWVTVEQKKQIEELLKKCPK